MNDSVFQCIHASKFMVWGLLRCCWILCNIIFRKVAAFQCGKKLMSIFVPHLCFAFSRAENHVKSCNIPTHIRKLLTISLIHILFLSSFHIINSDTLKSILILFNVFLSFSHTSHFYFIMCEYHRTFKTYAHLIHVPFYFVEFRRLWMCLLFTNLFFVHTLSFQHSSIMNGRINELKGNKT